MIKFEYISLWVGALKVMYILIINFNNCVYNN